MKCFQTVILVLSLFLLVGCGVKEPQVIDPTPAPTFLPNNENSKITIGIATSSVDDYILKEIKNLNSDEVEFEFKFSKNQQFIQLEQIDELLAQDITTLVVSVIDHSAVAPIIEKVKQYDLPLIFIGKEPTKSEISNYSKAWFVGIEDHLPAEQAGEIIASYFKETPSCDRNSDATLQYVSLSGTSKDMSGYTNNIVDSINKNNIATESLADVILNCDREDAKRAMNKIIKEKGLEQIEVVLTDHDILSLGIIDSLKSFNYNLGQEQYIPVVSIGGTNGAIESMSRGELLGTVLIDYKSMLENIIKIANGENVASDRIILIPSIKMDH